MRYIKMITASSAGKPKERSAVTRARNWSPLATFAGLPWKLAISPSAVDQYAHIFLDFPASSYAICFVYSLQPVQL